MLWEGRLKKTYVPQSANCKEILLCLHTNTSDYRNKVTILVASSSRPQSWAWISIHYSPVTSDGRRFSPRCANCVAHTWTPLKPWWPQNPRDKILLTFGFHSQIQWSSVHFVSFDQRLAPHSSSAPVTRHTLAAEPTKEPQGYSFDSPLLMQRHVLPPISLPGNKPTHDISSAGRHMCTARKNDSTDVLPVVQGFPNIITLLQQLIRPPEKLNRGISLHS